VLGVDLIGDGLGQLIEPADHARKLLVAHRENAAELAPGKKGRRVESESRRTAVFDRVHSRKSDVARVDRGGAIAAHEQKPARCDGDLSLVAFGNRRAGKT
jgi:hypothetical protein